MWLVKSFVRRLLWIFFAQVSPYAICARTNARYVTLGTRCVTRTEYFASSVFSSLSVRVTWHCVRLGHHTHQLRTYAYKSRMGWLGYLEEKRKVKKKIMAIIFDMNRLDMSGNSHFWSRSWFRQEKSFGPGPGEKSFRSRSWYLQKQILVPVPVKNIMVTVLIQKNPFWSWSCSAKNLVLVLVKKKFWSR
jgi:hypothetical protein